MAARKLYTGYIFLRDQEMADDKVQKLETTEGYFFVEKPRPATEEEIDVFGRNHIYHSAGWKLWTYTWRFATDREKRARMDAKRKEGVYYPFQIIN